MSTATATKPATKPESAPAGERIEEEIIRSARSKHQRLPVLEVIFDRFALALGPELKGYCSGGSGEAVLESFEYMSCGDALEGIESHGLAAVTRVAPWDGMIAVVLDPELLFTTLELMLGGRTVARRDWAPRAYSAIEKKFARRLIDRILSELAQSFSQLCELTFDVDRIEASPQAMVLAPPASPCVKVTMRVTLEERSGTLTFLFPHTAFESVRPLLAQPFHGGQLGGDSSWRAQLTDRLQDTAVTLDAVLHEPRLNLQDVLDWQPGQVLDLGIDPDQEVTVTCSGMKMFSAAMGRRRNGSVALRVTRDYSEKEASDVASD